MKSNQQVKFKETEIGKIPEDWGEKEIGEYFKVNTGKGIHKSERLPDGMYPIMGANGIIGYTNKFLVDGKYILTGRVGTLGEVTLKSGRFWISDNTIYIETENKGNLKFLYYYLKTYDFQSLNVGSTQPLVKQSEVKKIKFPFPSLAEQNKVADILYSLDSKVEVNQQMNKTLEAIGQALFKRWFVDFEFPDGKGKPYKSSGGEMVDSELGKMPKEWSVGRLNEVLSRLESGSRPKGGVGLYSEGVPSIGAENIFGLGEYDYPKTKYVPLEFFEKMESGKIKDGDVLLYKDGAQLGRKSFFMCSFPFNKCCINEHVFILRTNELICPIYLYFWLDQSWMTEEIKNLNTNSAQPGINQKGVNSLKILIPTQNVIKEFNKIANPIISQIFKNCLQSYNLSQIRDSLLPRLMSGRIRVGVA